MTKPFDLSTGLLKTVLSVVTTILSHKGISLHSNKQEKLRSKVPPALRKANKRSL